MDLHGMRLHSFFQALMALAEASSCKKLSECVPQKAKQVLFHYEQSAFANDASPIVRLVFGSIALRFKEFVGGLTKSSSKAQATISGTVATSKMDVERAEYNVRLGSLMSQTVRTRSGAVASLPPRRASSFSETCLAKSSARALATVSESVERALAAVHRTPRACFFRVARRAAHVFRTLGLLNCRPPHGLFDLT